jgi:hypothetical protein
MGEAGRYDAGIQGQEGRNSDMGDTSASRITCLTTQRTTL